jgi:beta-lactamase superfamily II metal-dependent hydrolase
MAKVTHAEVRMYRMGTGDCFALKFFAGQQPVFKMMIDAGAWLGPRTRLQPYIRDLKKYLDDYADVLLVTHEHQDHVYAFEAAESLFTDGKFRVGEIWLAWTENERTSKVQEWQQKYGEKKKALGLAATRLAEVIASEAYKKQFAGSLNAGQALAARKTFAAVLTSFADLHLSLDDRQVYKGGLAGMEVVKKKIAAQDTRYFKPGDVIRDLGEAEGLKVYVLGPPERYNEVRQETGPGQQTYEPNGQLQETDAFSAAVLQDPQGQQQSLLPFDEHYVAPAGTEAQRQYEQADWRRIDFDWLYSAGSFALRLNSLTNNLSLAIAIEFEASGKVMLFPGDAEFDSWASWHRIAWQEKRPETPESRDEKEAKPLTEDLLNRTVFYKVAHHLSHNGTARKLGLEMMHHPELTAMATLDYSVIPPGWARTMPNRALIRELLARTKGRLLIMKEEELFFDYNKEVPLRDKITEARRRLSARERKEFEDNLKQTDLYIQYTVKG